MPCDALGGGDRVLQVSNQVVTLERWRRAANAFLRTSLLITLVIHLISVYYFVIELRPKRFGLAARLASD
jgi:hypothetical protein